MTMLVRKLSFSRVKRAPADQCSIQKPCDSTASEASSSEPDSPKFSSENTQIGVSVELCSTLHGWLLKKHKSAKMVSPQWSRRYFIFNDNSGFLSYSKGPKMKSRALIALSDIRSVDVVDKSPNVFQLRVSPSCGFTQLVLAAEDREECLMWTQQLGERLRASREQKNSTRAPPVVSHDAARPTIGSKADAEHVVAIPPCVSVEAPAISPTDAKEPPAPNWPQNTHILEDDGSGVLPRCVAARPKSAVPQLARVLCDFQSEHPLELSVACGEAVLPSGQLAPAGWMHVLTGGSSGLVPASYLELIAASTSSWMGLPTTGVAHPSSRSPRRPQSPHGGDDVEVVDLDVCGDDVVSWSPHPSARSFGPRSGHWADSDSESDDIDDGCVARIAPTEFLAGKP